MPLLKAVIFDMDGLLIDSEPFWRASHIAALADQGVAIDEEEIRQMAGTRSDEVVKHWLNTYDLLHITHNELENIVVNNVIREIKLHGKELPGVRHAIALVEEHHLPIAIASSSPPELIDAVVAKLGLDQHLALTYSAKFEDRGKPDPGVFLTTAKKLGVEPENCLVFEDALSGIKAAKAAGMRCIAIPESVNLNKTEFYDEADLVLNSLNQLTWTNVEKLF